jgi:uncharacterized Zn-finger protein
MATRYPKFRNDHAVPEIRIGVKEFNCIGVSPPHDHPHIFINMGYQDAPIIRVPVDLHEQLGAEKRAEIDAPRPKKLLSSWPRDKGTTHEEAMTPRQQRFVDEYLVDLNATRAAVRAGYSARTAEQQGARLLGNVKVAAAVQAALEARSDRIQISQDDVLRGLHREATLTGEGSSHAARVSAWSLLGKHLGMFVERRQQLGEDGQAVNPQLYTISIT